MSVIVRIPPTMRAFANGASQVSTEGTTVGLVLKDLCQQYPGLESKLLDGSGELPRYLNVHIELAPNDSLDVKFEQGLDTPVLDGQTIAIMAAVAGG